MNEKIFSGYKTIGKLILKMVALAVMLAAIPAGAVDILQKQTKPQTAETQTRKYPPYPDVWGYRFPMSERFRSSQIRVHKMSNGDYGVTYLIDISKKDGPPEWRLEGIYFFSGKKIESKDLERIKMDRNIRGKIVGQSDIRIDNEISWERDQACFSCCPEYSQHPITKYAPYRTNEQLSIVYFSDEPIRQGYFEPSEKCIGQGGWQRFGDKVYYQQVFAVFPIFVPLKDGTFLLYDSFGNIIIRLDKDFKSKSDLFRNIFIVNTADIKTLEKRLFEMDIFNRQTYDKVVAVYIKALKKGMQREVALQEALGSTKQMKEGKNNGN
jgi:hypothetical protein